MDDFLKFFAEKVRHYPMHFELTYCKICDWELRIYRKGCAPDGGNIEICHIQDNDLEYVCASAQVALKDFLLENDGGY